MKFNRLILTNIGAFRGSHDFYLRTTDKEKNVILFGGKNGSGKTTILEALRLVLFGTFAFGLKTESAVYFEKIEAKLNTFAKKQNERLYQVILDLELVENLKRNYYTLNRSWSREKGTIKEKLIVIKNGQKLDPRDVELFQAKLREETPPQLLEFCLFDGEKISQVVSNETLSLYLQQTAKVMFNLDLFENLESDLGTYIKQDDIFNLLSTEEKKMMDVEKEINELYEEKHTILLEFEYIDKTVDETKAALTDSNRQFDVNGGLVKERREALMSQMNEIEHQRMLTIEKNKEFIASSMPFTLVRDLLNEAIQQMHREAKLDVKNTVQNTISEHDFQQMVIQHLPYQDEKEELKEKSKLLYSYLLDKLFDDEINITHNASTQQRAEVEGVFSQIREFHPDTMLHDFKENSILLKKIQKIRKQIDENDASSDLKELLNTMQRLQNDSVSMQFKKEQLQIVFVHLQERIQAKENEYLSLKNKMLHAKKAGHIFEIATRVKDVSRLFRERQMKKKLQQVELETARMLQTIYRKDLFVTRVKIDPETFQLRIFDSNQEEVNIDILSAGEKQILLLSTVWAMAMCSKRRLPFVFDTLLGRLDQTHKKSMIEHFIPRCGEQVIILSTDSEINEEHYQEIKKIVAKTYTIDFNTDTSNVTVTEDYFNLDDAAEESKYELSPNNFKSNR